MNNLLQTILSSQGGAIVNQISKNFGLSDEVTSKAITKLLPALSRGIQNNTQQEGGLEKLISAISGEKAAEFFDRPEELASSNAVNEGNGILGMIFNDNKDISRNIASHAAKETNVDYSILKKMLPILASVVIGSITKQAAPQSGGAPGMLGALAGLAGSSQQQQKEGLDLGALASFLDADKDGSVIDDVLNLAKRFF